ncbi:hypothetical protein [Roseateles aquatilis]|uniref:hypothetical protein n=1 Tax=Roseateles aquatilis TaxID=431061 RepID=UPI001131790D|nr:hypothetical protein [Roseateles aquatilis]
MTAWVREPLALDAHDAMPTLGISETQTPDGAVPVGESSATGPGGIEVIGPGGECGFDTIPRRSAVSPAHRHGLPRSGNFQDASSNLRPFRFMAGPFLTPTARSSHGSRPQ